jgi:2'-5' RNA ligase
VAEAAVAEEWRLLHEAGLPSELRPGGDESHRPHLTLFAGPEIPAAAEPLLEDLVTTLALTLEVGALMLFGPHRDRYILVHQVVPTAGLLALQTEVAAVCGADPAGHFGPGHWSPHVTVARRVPGPQLPQVLAVLGAAAAVGHPARVTRCRRWDSDARRTWLL